MKNWLLALLFVLLANAAYTQGINGKRLSAEGEFDYFMRFFAPTEKVFTIGGKARIGYVVAERWQLYAGINYYKLNYLHAVQDTLSHDVLGDATDQISCMEFDITARYFLHGFGDRSYDCIAPDGKYFEFGVITTKTMYTPGDLPAYHDDELLTQVHTTRLSLGLGNQQVWWNVVVVNTGILGSFPVYKWGSISYNEAPYLSWQTGHNILRAYVSIGVML